MSTNEPTLAQRIETLRTSYTDLQRKTAMDGVTRKLGDVATEIAGLPAEIELIRQRGYAFASYLERKVEVLATQWDEVRQQVSAATTQEINQIQQQFHEITDLWSKLDSQWSDQGKEQIFNQIKQAVDRVSTAVDGAVRRLEGMYGQVPSNVSQTKSQLATIKRYIDLAGEATVSWNPTEAIFLVVEAEWIASKKDKPKGVLYLTDQRLIFEQKQKVGSTLGIGGKKVQDVLWTVPVGTISEARAEDKGLFGSKDMVHLKLKSGDHAELSFEVKSGGVDSKWYVQQLNRAITGEIENERAIPVDQVAVQTISTAPTACTTCGATLPAITRGMTEIACEYCGTVIRL